MGRIRKGIEYMFEPIIRMSRNDALVFVVLLGELIYGYGALLVGINQNLIAASLIGSMLAAAFVVYRISA
jgi:hypothetical protein